MQKIYDQIRKRSKWVYKETILKEDIRKEYWWHNGFLYIVTLKLNPCIRDRVINIRGQYRKTLIR